MRTIIRVGAAALTAFGVTLAAQPAFARTRATSQPTTACQATLHRHDHSVTVTTNGHCQGYELTMHELPSQKLVGESPTGPLTEPCGPFQVDFSKGTYPDWSFIAGFKGDHHCTPPSTTTTSTTTVPEVTTTAPEATSTTTGPNTTSTTEAAPSGPQPTNSLVPHGQPPLTSALAYTGTPADLDGMVATGLGSIAAGGLLLLRRRRR